MKKMCYGCHKEFETNYPQTKFCSKECRQTPCVICETPIDNPRRDKKTCSYECKGLYQKRHFSGKNNPNFGKKWDKKKRKMQSDLIKSKIDDEYRLKVGSANRGKTFSKERIERMHGHRGPETYGVSGKGHSEETKQIIRKKSKEKFTDEYKQKHRNTMEASGHWIPLNEKTDYEIYFVECDWIHKMFDIIENGIEMIEEHGIFNNKSNTKGIVRDHIVGRKYGYKYGIFPEIMRHPANCRIIKHNENVSKGQRGKGRPDADISIEELFDRIINFDGYWFEQDKCLDKIEEYKNGNRWKRKGGKRVSESE